MLSSFLHVVFVFQKLDERKKYPVPNYLLIFKIFKRFFAYAQNVIIIATEDFPLSPFVDAPIKRRRGSIVQRWIIFP
jgi:hypothetical protein